MRTLFRKYLKEQGVKDSQILSFELDLARDIKYRDPLVLADYVRSLVDRQAEQFYLFVDEIQMSDEIPNPYNADGKNYFDYPSKYYCEDLGLRNARIGFRQQEMTHIMENIIYNELIIRGCTVDVCIVYGNGKNKKGRTVPVVREIDFVATLGGKRVYIQSAYALQDETKAETENKPFALTGDSFPKIIVRHDIRKRWYDDNGVLNIGIIDFLLDPSLI